MKKKVDVFEITPEGEELRFTVTYDGKKIKFINAPEELVKSWKKYGLPAMGRERRLLKPEDGLEFLKAMSREFVGSIFKSGPVEEVEEE